jgi:hypothetical protein
MTFPEYVGWSRLLMEEFYGQFCSEGELKLEQTAMLNVNSEETFLKGQFGFIKFLGLPLW